MKLPDHFPFPTISQAFPEKVPMTVSRFPLSKRGNGNGGRLSVK